MKDHRPDCCGWEDCNCFYTSVRNERLDAYVRAVEVLKRIYKESEQDCMHELLDCELREIKKIIKDTQ